MRLFNFDRIRFVGERIVWHIAASLRLKVTHPSFHLLHTFSIAPDAQFGRSARVQVFEQAGTLKIGARCSIEATLILERANSLIRLGDDVSIGEGTVIHSAQSVIIGNHVLIADAVIIRDHDAHGLMFSQRREERSRAGLGERYWEVVSIQPVTIDEGAWIASRAILLKGVHIGRGAVVGAGAVVTGDVPAWTVVAGNPARPVKQLTPEQ